MTQPKGFSIAGAGYARTFRSLESAQRAFKRLTGKGYTCSVVKVSGSSLHAVLVAKPVIAI